MAQDPEKAARGASAGSPPIQRVRGTNDFLPPDDARLRRLARELQSGFELFGYQGIQTPILEPLELFLRKSGDEIAARMFAFSHWNRRLCLRPELTASIMRAYVNEMQGRSLPLRLHYSGPIFRYEKPQRGRYRQFTQVGLELIGASGPAADAEVLHLACAGLDATGVGPYRLVVGHLGALLQLLGELGMSEHGQGLILDHLEPLVRGRIGLDAAVARVVELLGGPSNGRGGADELGLPDVLSDLPQDEATAIAAEILRRASLPIEGGARRPSQIVQRLLAKARRPDPTAQVRAAFEFVLELHDAGGAVARLGALRQVLERRGLSTQPLDDVAAALDMLRAYGGPAEGATWEVDLSLARGLRYYTGMVFEAYVETPEGPLQVCGGGRYDDLVRALGGREAVPACGFSFGLERLDLVRPTHEALEVDRPRVLVAGVTGDDYAEAVAVAAELRRAGVVVEQDVRIRGPKAALRHADRTGVRAAIILGERERSERVAVVRSMASREEERVPRARLVEHVRQVLA